MQPYINRTAAPWGRPKEQNGERKMATYDLNRLWLTVAGNESLDALRKTNPETSTEELRVIYDFWAPTRRPVEKTRVAEIS